MFATIAFIRRFGLRRGWEFRKVARLCDHDPKLLKSWEAYYRWQASRQYYHSNNEEARVFNAFAEMLQTTHDKLVAKRKSCQPMLQKQHQRVERAIQRRIQSRAQQLKAGKAA